MESDSEPYVNDKIYHDNDDSPTSSQSYQDQEVFLRSSDIESDDNNPEKYLGPSRELSRNISSSIGSPHDRVLLDYPKYEPNRHAAPSRVATMYNRKKIKAHYVGHVFCFYDTLEVPRHPRREFEVTIRVYPSDLQLSEDFPDYPNNIQWFGEREISMEEDLLGEIGNKSLQLLAHLMVEFDGQTGSPSSIQSRIVKERHPHIFSSRSPSRFGPYVYHPLFAVNRDHIRHAFGRTSIVPSRAVFRDFPDLPAIEVISGAKNRIFSTLTEILSGFTDGLGVEMAWEMGRDESIAENARIESGDAPGAQTQHSCTEKSFDKWHVCPTCLKAAQCIDFILAESFGVDVCSRCHQGIDSNPDSSTDTIRSRVKERITVAVRRDNTNAGHPLGLNERKEIVEEIYHGLSISSRLPDGPKGEIRWKDSYIDQALPDRDNQYVTVTSGHRESPFVASIDAVAPLAVHHLPSGTRITGYHLPGNIALTSVSINRLKYQYGSIVLPAIYMFRHAQDQDEINNAWNGLLNIGINNCEVALTSRRRLQQGIKPSDKRIKEIQDAFRTGELLKDRHVPDDKLFQVLEVQRRGNLHDVSWRAPNYKYRQEQFRQIAVMYDFDPDKDNSLWTIMVNGNPVLYLFCTLSKPFMRNRWNDWICECWYKERLQRMRNLCNKKFETDATVETLMMMHMHDRLRKLKMDRDSMDQRMIAEGLTVRPRILIARDRTGCDTVPWIRSILTAALGKDHPNQKMTVAYNCVPQLPSNQVEQYDNTLGNIGFITQGENFLCWDYPEEMWPEVAAQIDNLRIDDSAFWPGGNIIWRTKFVPGLQVALFGGDTIESLDTADTLTADPWLVDDLDLGLSSGGEESAEIQSESDDNEPRLPGLKPNVNPRPSQKTVRKTQSKIPVSVTGKVIENVKERIKETFASQAALENRPIDNTPPKKLETLPEKLFPASEKASLNRFTNDTSLQSPVKIRATLGKAAASSLTLPTTPKSQLPLRGKSGKGTAYRVAFGRTLTTSQIGLGYKSSILELSSRSPPKTFRGETAASRLESIFNAPEPIYGSRLIDPPDNVRRRNYGRLKATCYISAPLQAIFHTPELRSILSGRDSNIKEQSGRPERYFQTGANLLQHKALFNALAVSFNSLDIWPGDRLSPDDMKMIQRCSEDMWSRWVDEPEDAAHYLAWMLDFLNTCCDKSEPLKGARDDRPLAVLNRRQTSSQLLKEAEDYWMAWCQEGHDSAVTDALGFQSVEEVLCGKCKATSRRFQQHYVLQLHIPQDTPPRRSVQLEFLLDCWRTDVDPLSCKVEGSTETTRQTLKALCRLPKILNVHIGRSRHGSASTIAQQEKWPFDNHIGGLEKFYRFDFRPWVCDNYSTSLSTIYDLVKIIVYHPDPQHYATFCRLPLNDMSGRDDWVLFDDTYRKPAVIRPTHPSFLARTCEYVLFFRRVDSQEISPQKLANTISVERLSLPALEFSHQPPDTSDSIIVDDTAQPVTSSPISESQQVETEALSSPYVIGEDLIEREMETIQEHDTSAKITAPALELSLFDQLRMLQIRNQRLEQERVAMEAKAKSFQRRELELAARSEKAIKDGKHANEILDGLERDKAKFFMEQAQYGVRVAKWEEKIKEERSDLDQKQQRLDRRENDLTVAANEYSQAIGEWHLPGLERLRRLVPRLTLEELRHANNTIVDEARSRFTTFGEPGDFQTVAPGPHVTASVTPSIHAARSTSRSSGVTRGRRMAVPVTPSTRVTRSQTASQGSRGSAGGSTGPIQTTPIIGSRRPSSTENTSRTPADMQRMNQKVSDNMEAASQALRQRSAQIVVEGAEEHQDEAKESTEKGSIFED